MPAHIHLYIHSHAFLSRNFHFFLQFSSLKASAQSENDFEWRRAAQPNRQRNNLKEIYDSFVLSVWLWARRQCAQLNALLVGRVESVRACVSEHSSNWEPRGNKRLQSYTLRRQNYSIEIYLVANVGSRLTERRSNSKQKKRLFLLVLSSSFPFESIFFVQFSNAA